VITTCDPHLFDSHHLLDPLLCVPCTCHVVSWWGPFAPKARVLDIAAVLHATRMPISTWYAKGGKDIVHPNPLGHALLGHLVARFVASGLWAGRDELSNATMNATEPEGDAPLSAILDHEQEGNSTLPGEQHDGEAEQQPATATTTSSLMPPCALSFFVGGKQCAEHFCSISPSWVLNSTEAAATADFHCRRWFCYCL